MDCSPPGSSVHGILQARILEWVTIPLYMGSSQPRDGTGVSYFFHSAGKFFFLLSQQGEPKGCVAFLSGNQIPVSSVTGGNSHHYTNKAGEGNGIPLQYSCLENPMTEEPGGLQSMGSWRVGHDWVTSLWLFTFMHWRRKWQPTPVFLPGESQGRGSLVGSHLWGHTELDRTEAT